MSVLTALAGDGPDGEGEQHRVARVPGATVIIGRDEFGDKYEIWVYDGRSTFLEITNGTTGRSESISMSSAVGRELFEALRRHP